MPAGSDRGRPERPEYKVYRSRPGLLGRLRSRDAGSVPKAGGGGGGRDRGGRPRRPPSVKDAGGARPGWRRALRWAGIAALAWILVSIVAFMVSAQIQSSKLSPGASKALHGNPFLAVSPQTILVLGSDVRPSGLASPGEASSPHCITAAGEGRPPPKTCPPYRSDTILLVRAGGKTFRKLSIPRDTLATIPGHGGEKINSAYAFGGAKLAIKTVEKLLGINIDHIAIVDFSGFRDFINSVGGVEVTINKKVCSQVSGGAANGGFSLFLDPGTHTLDADQALTLARTRENVATDPQGNPCPPLSDIDRVAFQQDILNGLKSRLTSISRLPYNFLHAPFIAWNAPRAFVSDMGAFTLPQLVFSAAISGSSGTDVLKPASTDAAGNLVVSQSECVRAATALLGHAPPKNPACSPAPTG